MYKFSHYLVLILVYLGLITGCASIDSNYYKKDYSSNLSRDVIAAIPGIEKIVVLVLPRKNAPDRHIENEFIQGLINKNYVVASRYDLPKLTQELIFQQSSLTQSEAAKLGKILNAHAVLIVEVTELETGKSKQGNSYISRLSMAARLIDVETTNILWIRSKTNKPSSLIENFARLPMDILIGQNGNKFDTLISKLISEFPNKS